MSLFGASTNQSNLTFGSTANTQSSAGTLFGANTNTNNPTGTNTNSSAGTLFGTSSNSSAGTLFGNATPNSSSGGFGGFGQKSAATNTFGMTSSAPTTGFGQTTQATGFGQTTPAASTFSFGAAQPAANNTSGFGTSGANATGLGSFGALNAGNTNQTGFGGFGQNNTQQTGFGLQGQQLGLQGQQQGQQVQEKIWQELALIRAQFDPASPLCHFRHYFYNNVPPNEVHLYVRPPNQDEHLWNEAVRKNPNPSSQVPVLAVGFDDILKRMEFQNQQSELCDQKLKEAEDRLASVHRVYTLGTLVKLEEHKRRHINITQRLLRLLRYSQILRFKNFPLNAEEDKTIQQIQAMAGASNGPQELYTKMVDLWNKLQVLQTTTGKTEDTPNVWRSISEEDSSRLAKVLENDQLGISHVAAILKKDTKEIEDIVGTIKTS